MYLEHFGLKELPFSLTPDTSFFAGLPAHQECMNTIMMALHSGEGFIQVVGEVGTGKTLLCRKTLNALDQAPFYTLWIANPFCSAEQLLRLIAEELQVDMPSENDALSRINHRLLALAAERRQVVLLIDEAQVMSREALECLRLLSNLETEKRKLLQIVLFAQPEILSLLGQQDMRQLAQRISYRYQLPPLNEKQTERYIAHRLTVAGYHRGPLIERAAFKKIFRFSQGVPRLINLVSHKALLATFGEGSDRVQKRHVTQAIRDTELPGAEKRRRWFGKAA